MEAKRIVSAVLKLWVLALLGGAIYFLWKGQSPPPLAGRLEAADAIARTNVEVKVGMTRKMTLHGYVVGFGNVEGAPAGDGQGAADARITVDWPGVVWDVRCVEGEHVEKGQTLFFARPENYLPEGIGGSKGEVKSPIAGTVVLVDVHSGEVALPTKTAVEVVDLDRLVMAVGIPAWEAGTIFAGQRATVEIPGNGGSTLKFDSRVARVDAGADAKTNLVSVDISVPANAGARLGQFGRVSIANREQADCLVVPADAIVRDALDRAFVGVVSDDRKQAILKPVVPGLREGDWVQVTGDGFSEGETIVVGGAYGLQYRTDIDVLNP